MVLICERGESNSTIGSFKSWAIGELSHGSHLGPLLVYLIAAFSRLPTAPIAGEVCKIVPIERILSLLLSQ